MVAPWTISYELFVSNSHTVNTALLSYILVCLLIYLCIVHHICLDFLLLKSFKDFDLTGKKILIITAHPDDECMFFSPAITHLNKASEIFLFCITSGDYNKKGEVRKKELFDSCKVLGVADKNIKILDDSAFPDDPHADWNLTDLVEKVQATVNSLKPAYVLTFDNYGVSGHTNHISVSKTARQLFQTSRFYHGDIKLFELESVSLLRKFVSFLDLPFSLASGHMIFVSPISDILRAQKAMCAHKSQLVCFRALYIIFSRYMVINTFREVETSKKSARP